MKRRTFIKGLIAMCAVPLSILKPLKGGKVEGTITPGLFDEMIHSLPATYSKYPKCIRRGEHVYGPL